jgi:hypothetical protein
MATKAAEAAVKAACDYAGSLGLPIKTQQRFYKRFMKRCDDVVKHTGISRLSVIEQVTAEATRRGPTRLQPGKDY